MKKILFIAYQFPPLGGAGVFRSVNFYDKLPLFGYDPIVVTVDKKTIFESKYTTDESLCSVIRNEEDVIRLKGYSSKYFVETMMKWKIYRIIWFFFFGLLREFSILWAILNIKKVEEIIKKHNIKLIYTTSSPYSSWLMAIRLKKRLNIKWVADLRDPFTDGYMWKFPSKIHWLIMRKREEKWLKQADKVIVNTPEVEKLYRKRNFLSPEKITVITNGF